MEAFMGICAANNASYEFLESDFEEMKKLVTEMIILNQPLSMSFVKAYQGESTIHHNGTR